MTSIRASAQRSTSLQEAGQSAGRIRWLVGDPDGVVLGTDPDRGLLGAVVPGDLGDRPPVFAVVAGDREDARPHRAGAGLAVVLAQEVGQGQDEVAVAGPVDPEEVPARLPVAPVLVLLALHVAAERGLAEPFDRAQRGALEFGVEADGVRLGCGGHAGEEAGRGDQHR